MAPSFYMADSVALAAADVLREYGLEPVFHEGYAHIYPEGAEPPYCYSGTIDRYLNIILQHPEGLKGVVVCDFTNCDLLPHYPSVEYVLNEYLSKLGVPVCYGFHAGHGELNLPLIEGATLEMNVTGEGSSLKFLL